VAKYFFRDIDCEANSENGMDFYAAGVVVKRYNENSVSGRDLEVVYLHPFGGYIERAWRSDKDVVLFETILPEWELTLKIYEEMEAPW